MSEDFLEVSLNDDKKDFIILFNQKKLTPPAINKSVSYSPIFTCVKLLLASKILISTKLE